MIYPDSEERNSLIDALCDVHQFPEHEHLEMSDFRRLSTRQLQQMLNREPVAPEPIEQPAPEPLQPTLQPLAWSAAPAPTSKAPEPLQPALRPLTLSEAMDLYPDFKPKPKRKRGMAPRLYKAQLKHEGKNVYLGSFYTDIEAYAAVQQAKFRRSVGLPIK